MVQARIAEAPAAGREICGRVARFRGRLDRTQPEAAMRTALFVTLLATGALLADDERANPKGLQSFQGTWKIAEHQRGGKVVKDDVHATAVVFKGDKYKMTDKNGKSVEEGTITVHPEKTPLLIEVVATSGMDKGKKWHGVYEIEGPVLRAVVSPADEKRPMRLDETPANSRGFTLKREAKKK
jgi:uncharacterized protein (TIGR03067 family)